MDPLGDHVLVVEEEAHHGEVDEQAGKDQKLAVDVGQGHRRRHRRRPENKRGSDRDDPQIGTQGLLSARILGEDQVATPD